MAAADQLQDLREEATCSICLEYFKDPVSIECGHNFCRSCITQCWEGSDPNFPCPQCRETSPGGNLRPSRQLGNMVEMLKKRPIPTVKPQEGNLCQKHAKKLKLKLFCEEDQNLICLVCRESRDHKSHSVLPIEEAVQEYKKTLQIHLEKLQKQLKDLQGWTTEKSRTASELEGKYKSQKDRILSAFEELKQFLEQEKQRLLSSLKKEQEEEIKRIRGKVTELEKQQSTLKDLITEIEGKCQQQDVQLLKDVRSFLSRSNNVTVQKPKDDSADVEKNLQSFSAQHVYLQEKIKELKETFPAELDLRGRFRTCKVPVTLDPDSAHPRLVLFEERRRVRRTDRAQPLPDNNRRFTGAWPCVLGSEGFTSGRYYWELQLLQEGEGWYVGVAGESVSRKGEITRSPEGGVWAVSWYNGQYRALTSPLTPLERPGKLGVYLDYEGGRLSLYNADTMEHLYTFPRAPFTQRLFPFFCLWGGAELRLV